MHHCLQAFRCKLCNYTAERRRPECAAHPYAVERMEVGRLLAACCCAKGCTALPCCSGIEGLAHSEAVEQQQQGPRLLLLLLQPLFVLFT